MITKIKLIETLDEVIRKGFPELMNEDFQTDFEKLDNALFEYGPLID